ncbi:hypothetical protein CAL26_21230 [Bordetella genomosp. 9]|uniref:Uncharacterized protein n=1 Tax=Bordetella genomosp. 9 TaxID=1416803 RepID=A0A261R671_9BORD|nr:hypothetical protein [Bordetella genomosp. 9]OZI20080.1 hypothetical protein CAL26_21230 [Bordetella genomosp. 9]
MKQTVVTAFSLAHAVGIQKHADDKTFPPIQYTTEQRKAIYADACEASINRTPASNPGHPRHARRRSGLSARQWRICTRKSHALRMFG